MNILMLSQDMKLFDIGPTAERIASYGRVFDTLTLVVFGTGPRRERALAPNVRVVTPGGKGKAAAFLRGLREVHRATRASRPDVISVQDPFFVGLAGAIVARRAKVPLQVQVHTDPFSRAFAAASVRQGIESFIARGVLRAATCIRAVSERVAAPVRRIAKAPVSVLPIVPLVPDTRTAPVRDRSGRSFSILMVSRLTAEKQIHIAIDAMAGLEGVVLTVVGDGPLRARLEKRARERRVDDRVRFVGWHDDVTYFFANADAFLSLSRYEGYGRSLVEAALRGLPIITTDVGVVGELLRPGEDALVVRAEAADVAAALRRVVEDATLGHALGESAKARALLHITTQDEYLARYKEAMHTCIP